ncbi:uncharacterized protein LOC113467969 [Diaphorina citri]|uniref:Uncharacterized protein LOC113467969 n=1 Tax=Diaphorina citri TaxID=121845 RepID=A0A3Q0J043_DIACI|nr:uncharacterized protein LOC113467969 [Diaphorina citri]
MNLSSNWNWKTFVVVVVAFVLLIAICCFIQQVMILFMPLRMAFKCIGLVFTLCKAAIKLTWSLITKSIYTVFITLTACFRLLYWRKSKRKSNSPEKNGEKKPNVETSEDETESLIPDSRNARIVKFDKKSKTGRNKKGLNKFKMKAKKSNTKSKLQKFAGFMKKADRKQGIPKADENRDSSSSSRFSDSSNMSFMNPPSIAPPYRPQKHQPGNRNEPIPDQPLEVNSYHSAMSAPQKTLLKDVLLMSENEDDSTISRPTIGITGTTMKVFILLSMVLAAALAKRK